ncbi:hypothetical protein [Mesobacillus zeae]|nr:hypothetical protein [Mesobacillus zeae]
MDYTEFYHKENNSCIEWLESREDMEQHIIGKHTPEVHTEYEG